jgi:hypothetical protein
VPSDLLIKTQNFEIRGPRGPIKIPTKNGLNEEIIHAHDFRIIFFPFVFGFNYTTKPQQQYLVSTKRNFPKENKKKSDALVGRVNTFIILHTK